jgi:hypothetical protein
MREANLFTAAEIKGTGSEIDVECKRNEDMLKELKTEPLLDKTLKHKTNWI